MLTKEEEIFRLENERASIKTLSALVRHDGWSALKNYLLRIKEVAIDFAIYNKENTIVKDKDEVPGFVKTVDSVIDFVEGASIKYQALTKEIENIREGD